MAKNQRVHKYVQDQMMQDLSCSRKPPPVSAMFGEEREPGAA